MNDQNSSGLYKTIWVTLQLLIATSVLLAVASMWEDARFHIIGLSNCSMLLGLLVHLGLITA
jgi:hypothetical protein